MAESIVPLRKKIKDILTRQVMWDIRGLHRKELAEREEKERVLSSERAHKQVLTVKKNMRLILNSSTGTLVTVAISTVSDGRFHRESMCSQAKPAHMSASKKEKKRKRQGNYASSKKLLTSIKEKGPLGKKSPFTRKEKGGQRGSGRLWADKPADLS